MRMWENVLPKSDLQIDSEMKTFWIRAKICVITQHEIVEEALASLSDNFEALTLSDSLLTKIGFSTFVEDV